MLLSLKAPLQHHFPDTPHTASNPENKRYDMIVEDLSIAIL